MKTTLILFMLILIILVTLLGIFLFFNQSYQREVNLNKETLRLSSNQPLQILEKQSKFLKPENLIWVQVTPSAPWQPRDSGEAFIFKNKIWLMGGLDGNKVVNKNKFVEYWRAPHFNDIWYTEDGVNWHLAVSSSAWPPRRSMSVVFFKNKLWMLGGWSPITGYTNDIWISEDGFNWKKIVPHAQFPAAEGQTVVAFQNKLWKIGGVNYDKREVYNDVWYSENGLDWKKVENIPWQPRWDHAVAVFKGKLFLAGGMNLDGKVFNDVWVSEDGINWNNLTKKAPWAPRQGHLLLVYKDRLWLIGRLNDAENGGPNDVWFSDDGINWQKTKNDPAWTGREDFFGVVFKDRIWIFGGMDANWRWRNDIWMSDFKEQ